MQWVVYSFCIRSWHDQKLASSSGEVRPRAVSFHRLVRSHGASRTLALALLRREVQSPAVRAAKHTPIAYRWVWWSAARRLQRDEGPFESALPVQTRQPARTLLENPISRSHPLGVSGAFVGHHHRAGLPIHDTSESAATVERRGAVSVNNVTLRPSIAAI